MLLLLENGAADLRWHLYVDLTLKVDASGVQIGFRLNTGLQLVSASLE